MRYSALDIYSGLLQALGLLICCISIGVGIALGVYSVRSMQPGDSLLTVGIIAAGSFLGCLLGLVYAAHGQLLAAVMDIEHNTRVSIPRPALEEIYAND